MTKLDQLKTGEVGYIICSIKTIADAKIGDTITDPKNPAEKPLPGYKEVKPMVFSGFYPVDTQQYNDLKEALEKMKLNDAALSYEVESSQALGFGFRCGFLGLLHMEVTQERIQREFDIELVVTAPNVTYEIETIQGENLKVETPSDFPEVQQISMMKEPLMGLSVVTPSSYLGVVNELVKEARGLYKKAEILVLDEATSALDNETEVEIINSLKNLNKELTIISIAHRKSTLQNCDRIIELKKGKIIQDMNQKDFKDKYLV